MAHICSSRSLGLGARPKATRSYRTTSSEQIEHVWVYGCILTFMYTLIRPLERKNNNLVYMIKLIRPLERKKITLRKASKQ
jgi:hypothetical protein